MELLDAFKWRYATKKFDSNKKVEQELVDKKTDYAKYGISKPIRIIIRGTVSYDKG